MTKNLKKASCFGDYRCTCMRGCDLGLAYRRFATSDPALGTLRHSQVYAHIVGRDELYTHRGQMDDPFRLVEDLKGMYMKHPQVSEFRFGSELVKDTNTFMSEWMRGWCEDRYEAYVQEGQVPYVDCDKRVPIWSAKKSQQNEYIRKFYKVESTSKICNSFKAGFVKEVVAFFIETEIGAIRGAIDLYNFSKDHDHVCTICLDGDGQIVKDVMYQIVILVVQAEMGGFATVQMIHPMSHGYQGVDLVDQAYGYKDAVMMLLVNHLHWAVDIKYSIKKITQPTLESLLKFNY